MARQVLNCKTQIGGHTTLMIAGQRVRPFAGVNYFHHIFNRWEKRIFFLMRGLGDIWKGMDSGRIWCFEMNAL